MELLGLKICYSNFCSPYFQVSYLFDMFFSPDKYKMYTNSVKSQNLYYSQYLSYYQVFSKYIIIHLSGN
jgi:folate-binding Fe-S cluster repair protein YgfZ